MECINCNITFDLAFPLTSWHGVLAGWETERDVHKATGRCSCRSKQRSRQSRDDRDVEDPLNT